MGFVNLGGLDSLIGSYRLCWIAGRFGLGKTSLAYRMAELYLKRGYHLITNNKSIWADDMESVKLDKDGHLKAVIILDEGGLWFKSGKQIEMIAAYAAKMDCIYLLPSFWPPTRSACVVTVQPLFSLQQAGLPVIVYRWRVKLGAFSEQGHFLWITPSEIYGVYSRQDPGDVGQDIVSWLVRRTEEYRAMYGRANNGLPAMDEDDQVDVLRDVTNALGDAADEFTSVSKRVSRKRRL